MITKDFCLKIVHPFFDFNSGVVTQAIADVEKRVVGVIGVNTWRGSVVLASTRR